MSRHPNTPLRMTPRGDGSAKAEVDTHVSGNVARDGFERIAHRRHPGAAAHENDGHSPMSMFGGFGDRKSIEPQVGQQDFRYPPYAEE